MSFAIGDRVRLRTGGAAMEVTGLLEGGEIECCRPADPNRGATGLVTRHPVAALQSLDDAAANGRSDDLRAETEPSDNDLGPARPLTSPTLD